MCGSSFLEYAQKRTPKNVVATHRYARIICLPALVCRYIFPCRETIGKKPSFSAAPLSVAGRWSRRVPGGGDTGSGAAAAQPGNGGGAGTGGVRGGGGPAAAGAGGGAGHAGGAGCRRRTAGGAVHAPGKDPGHRPGVPVGRRDMPGRGPGGHGGGAGYGRGLRGGAGVPAAGPGGMGAVEDAGMRKSMLILLLAWWLVAPAWGADTTNGSRP